MEAVHLDTHVTVWLFTAGKALGLLSPRARAAIEEAGQLFVSPAVLLELALLLETGRITVQPQEILVSLGGSIGLELAGEPFAEVAAEAAKLTWTRDPFDRLIAGQARAAEEALVTRDRIIRSHLDLAVW
jgi:PIN domain nuclease of toxin-antitoxin system